MAADLSGKFYHGTVLKTDPVTYLVDITPTVETDGVEPILKGILLHQGFTRFFGYKDCALPEPGSVCLCAYHSRSSCYILGTIVEADRSLKSVPLRTVQRSVDAMYDGSSNAGGDKAQKQYPHNNNRPSDVVEGERVWNNDFGIMLQLMQQFAALKASDLSQIQVHLLDDLVRIISHNFEHFTSMGSSKIVQDGKYLHAEYGMTHVPEEALGQPKGAQATFENNTGAQSRSTSDDEKDVVDFKSKEKENLVAIERIKLFIGALGDLVNLMVVVPTDNVAHSFDGKAPDKDDAGVLQVHAATDGGLHIRSAKEIFLEKTNWIRVPVRKREFEDPTGTDGCVVILPTKQVFEFNQEYKKMGIPFLYALQAQDYIAHTTEKTNYDNFSTYADDIHTPIDRTNTTKIEDVVDADPTTPTKLIATKAGVYILPNGGIMLKEACGAAIILEGGNVYIQPANDLFLQPMRHIYSISGGITSIQSGKEIEIAAKHISVAGYEGVTVYAEKNDIALHSDSDLVLKAKESIYRFANNDITQVTNNITQKADNLFTEVAEGFGVTATGKAAAIFICSQGTTLVSATNALTLAASKTAVFAGATSTVVGTESQTLGIADAGTLGTFPVKGLMPDLSNTLSSVSDLLSTDITNMYPRFSEKKDVDDYVFTFNNADVTDLIIPQTIAQQEAKKFTRTELTLEYPLPLVNKTQPFPGVDKLNTYAKNPDALSNLDIDNGKLYNKATNLNSKSSIELGNLSQYKFYTLT